VKGKEPGTKSQEPGIPTKSEILLPKKKCAGPQIKILKAQVNPDLDEVKLWKKVLLNLSRCRRQE